MEKRIIEKTADGSDTLYIPELHEHYHSVKGAWTETEHIFIRCALLAHPKKELKVLEVGFGTGLNAFQTLLTASKEQLKVEYHSLEKYPLSFEEVNALNFSQSEDFKQLHQSLWNQKVIINDSFSLFKHHVDFTQLASLDIGNNFDIVYFDAFAPEKQPYMWSKQLFEQIYVLLNDGAILTTYCAKGVIRRMLQEIGFLVERLPGPPEGKREILRAIKQ